VLLQRQLRHLDAADEDGAAALWRRDELCDSGEQARLARAGAPHHAHLLARADGRADAAQRERQLVAVAQAHVAQLDAAVGRGGRGGRGGVAPELGRRRRRHRVAWLGRHRLEGLQPLDGHQVRLELARLAHAPRERLRRLQHQRQAQRAVRAARAAARAAGAVVDALFLALGLRHNALMAMAVAGSGVRFLRYAELARAPLAHAER